MKQRRRKKSFKEIEQHWYSKLKGFVDIEDTSNPDRPLKEWHSTKFTSDRSKVRQEQREKYNAKIAEFINSREINEICSLMVQHGNSSFGPKKLKKILELHNDGFTERAIAKKIRRSKNCIHKTLKKAKEWMKVA